MSNDNKKKLKFKTKILQNIITVNYLKVKLEIIFL